MKIRVIGHVGEGKFPFGTSGPWREFETEILSRGHEICGPDMDEGADAVISNSFNQYLGTYLVKNKIPIEKRILVLWEPYVVETTRYKKRVLSLFGSHFAPSIDWAKKIHANSFKWPQDEIQDEDVFQGWKSRIDRAVMVQGNKFSARKGELYSLRRRVITNLGTKFDFINWIKSATSTEICGISPRSSFGLGKKYKNYLGATEDKIKTLSRYKVAIVIENSPDFISEKLFDAIRAGCVTVYVGPEIKKYGISKDAVIQVESKSEVISKTVQLLLMESDEVLEKIAREHRENLREVSKEWNNTQVLSKLASDMLDILESN